MNCRPCPVCGSTRTKCWYSKENGKVFWNLICLRCGFQNKKLVGLTR